MNIILLNKTCKYHKLVFAKDFIFADQLKIQFKYPIGFLSRETGAMQTSGLTSKNGSSLQHSVLVVVWSCFIDSSLATYANNNTAVITLQKPWLVCQSMYMTSPLYTVRSEETNRKHWNLKMIGPNLAENGVFLSGSNAHGSLVRGWLRKQLVMAFKLASDASSCI